ncbi:zinc-dependent alcohol dehydrogenase [Kineococcus sp. SYSU DK006]|uniref:zinc-dependent alcohol dehydrogenase n=1 Tax=Kineococcus sp. SYSU DK006 TaxID=3383127 RepID=UPI003D7CFCE2
MRAGIISGRRQLEFKTFSRPSIAAPGTAVIDIALCGICGSDVSAYRDGEGYPPFLSGHEWVGTVVDVGSDVHGLHRGDRVIAATPPACGRCPMCLAGHAERCAELTALSFGTHPLTPEHGAYAERITMPVEALVQVPDGVSDEQAVMVEPATVALHAVRLQPIRLGDAAVVIGAGPVGLFAAQMLRLAGARAVTVVEPRARRRALALELGANTAVAPDDAGDAVLAATSGIGADVVLDCVGTESALRSAVELSRPGGTVVMVGVATGAVSISPLSWLSKEITLRASLAHLNHEFAMTMSFMESGQLRSEPMRERTIGLDGLEEALSSLASGGDEIKVVVDPRL